jgi:hypothetical protein
VLIDAFPIIVNPVLAEAVGLEESIILQRLHLSLKRNEYLDCSKKANNSYVCYSITDLKAIFRFWCETEISQTLSSLITQGLVITYRTQYKAENPLDEVRCYSIDYEKLSGLLIGDESSFNIGGYVKPNFKEGNL